MALRTVTRGGAYNRLADPAWEDPLDISYSRLRGGRWNPAGAFGALYLNRGVVLARAQAEHKLAGAPYGVEDLDPAEQHDLVDVRVHADRHLDCVTAAGPLAAGLNADYPETVRGRAGWPRCQEIGALAHASGLPGLASRSAATGAPSDAEELAVFDTAVGDVVMTGRRAFADWYFA